MPDEFISHPRSLCGIAFDARGGTGMMAYGTINVAHQAWRLVEMNYELLK